MKIAFMGIKGLPAKGGAERVVEGIIPGLLAGNNQVSVYCNYRYTKEVKFHEIVLIRIPCLKGKHLEPITFFLMSAFHALLFGRYDLVHLHNVESCFILPLLRLKHKVVVTSHGPAQFREKWSRFEKALIRMTEYPFICFSNIRTCVCSSFADEYKRRYGRDILYIPNGVEKDLIVDSVSAEKTLERLDLANKPFILFAAGRIMPSKGPHLLLEAARILNLDYPILIVGDFGHVPGYKEELVTLSTEKTIFLPLIESKAHLLGLVKLAHLFVFPSTIEAMSMMLLEAASLKAPIVCSDIPENKAILGGHGLYFQSGCADDLARKLAYALENHSSLLSIAQLAQERVRKEFLWDVITQKYMDIYNLTLTKGILKDEQKDCSFC
jgi:glycosyltransferase involved in cell wall biosynthesis